MFGTTNDREPEIITHQKASHSDRKALTQHAAVRLAVRSIFPKMKGYFENIETCVEEVEEVESCVLSFFPKGLLGRRTRWAVPKASFT